MMYFNRILCVIALLLPATVSMASETMRLPKGTATGDAGPSGCPVFTADLTIEHADSRTGQILFSEKGQESLLKADDDTVLRIPGVDAKQAGLDKLRTGSDAKVRYCGTDGKLLEVKVLRAGS